MERLFHIARLRDWNRAGQDGSYRVSTLGKHLDEVGFIHLSFAHQVKTVADANYRGMSDLLLLELDPNRLDATVVVEAVEERATSSPTYTARSSWRWSRGSCLPASVRRNLRPCHLRGSGHDRARTASGVAWSAPAVSPRRPPRQRCRFCGRPTRTRSPSSGRQRRARSPSFVAAAVWSGQLLTAATSPKREGAQPAS